MQLFNFYVLADDDGSSNLCMETLSLVERIGSIKFREGGKIFDFKSKSNDSIPDFIINAVFKNRLCRF